MINNPVVPKFTDAGTIAGLISAIILWGMVIAGILTLLYLVMGGIEWITSGGDKAGLEHARERITNSLIGLGISVSVWAIMSIVSTFLGLTFPCFPIPTISGVNNSTCPTPAPAGQQQSGSKTNVPPGGPPVYMKCTTDQDCVNAGKGRICENGDKCISTCHAWDNPTGSKPGSDSTCYAHGQSCNWTYTDQGAGKGICSDK